MKSKNDNLRYDRVRTYFKLNKKSFILASITGVIYNSLMALVPIVQGKLIDAFNAQDDVKYIIKFALTFLTFVIFIQVNRYFKRYYVRDFSNKMVLQMRRVSFKNLITDDISTFITESKGDIMNKNLSDIKDSAEGVRKILTEVYDSIILMLGYLISLMIMDWKTTLVITIFLVLSMVFANLMKKIIYKSTSEYKKTFSKSKDVTLNSLKNELYYRGFGVCHKYDAIYQNTQNELEKKSIKSMVFKGSLEPTYQAIALIGLFFVIYFCGIKVTSGTWLVGTFSAYLSTYVLVANKASKVGKVFNAATNFKVSWKRCSPYLERKEMARHGDYKLKGNRLVVSNLTFGYDKSFMLHNISFDAKCGEAIGICGMIHSGKSTLGGALSGLYDYEGSIKLLGLELKENKNSLIDHYISYAPAEVEIFNDTIKYNIAFENKDVEHELKMADLYDDVKEFPLKENEVLSNLAENPSGGQKKRLQIARCLYGSPKLIVLDDPFNAIDIKMSVDILNNIQNNYQESILVIINNQKEILSQMDKIIFLFNDSYIVGTYDELLQNEDFLSILGGKR